MSPMYDDLDASYGYGFDPIMRWYRIKSARPSWASNVYWQLKRCPRIGCGSAPTATDSFGRGIDLFPGLSR